MEKSVADRFWSTVLQRSVVSKCCREVLETSFGEGVGEES